MLIEKQRKIFGIEKVEKSNISFYFKWIRFYRMYQHKQEQILKTKTEEINKELDTFLG